VKGTLQCNAFDMQQIINNYNNMNNNNNNNNNNTITTDIKYNNLNMKKIIKDKNFIEIKNSNENQVFTNNCKNMADFIGISSLSSSFTSSSSSSSITSSTSLASSPALICVSHLSFIFPWIMLNHRKEFRRIGGNNMASTSTINAFADDIIIGTINPGNLNAISNILKFFYNFQFILIYFYYYYFLLILNGNFNLVLWKNATQIMQINDS
jgi:hypothetical protein